MTENKKFRWKVTVGIYLKSLKKWTRSGKIDNTTGNAGNTGNFTLNRIHIMKKKIPY